jgi:hypothetical protein
VPRPVTLLQEPGLNPEDIDVAAFAAVWLITRPASGTIVNAIARLFCDKKRFARSIDVINSSV